MDYGVINFQAALIRFNKLFKFRDSLRMANLHVLFIAIALAIVYFSPI